MSETKQLTTEEVNQLTSLRDELNTVYTNLGIVQSRIAELETTRNGVYRRFDELRSQEDAIFNTLREKYGEGTIDLANGLFTTE